MEGRGRPTSGVTNLVLVGKTGNGKSATGNSILGRRVFKSLSRSAPVTGTCQLEQGTTNDGRKLNVIDTPGLFDPNVTLEFLGKEIVKCIDLAKEGLHGVLLVLSVKNRFSTEEASTLQTLQTLFGDKIINYMVLVFTGGDELEANEQSLEDYLRDSSPILQEWSNRRKNIESGGYSKKEVQILLETMEKQHAEQLKKSAEAIEETLRKSTKMFEEQLAVEQSARKKAEEDSRVAISELEGKLQSPPPRRRPGVSISVTLPDCVIM